MFAMRKNCFCDIGNRFAGFYAIIGTFLSLKQQFPPSCSNPAGVPTARTHSARQARAAPAPATVRIPDACVMNIIVGMLFASHATYFTIHGNSLNMFVPWRSQGSAPIAAPEHGVTEDNCL
jgi:hypothetical protein